MYMYVMADSYIALTTCPVDLGLMTKQQFMEMYRQLFPTGDSSAFAEHVFQAYDVDGSGNIDFR